MERAAGGELRSRASEQTKCAHDGPPFRKNHLDTLVSLLTSILIPFVQPVQVDGFAKPDIHPRGKLRQHHRRDELLL